MNFLLQDFSFRIQHSDRYHFVEIFVVHLYQSIHVDVAYSIETAVKLLANRVNLGAYVEFKVLSEVLDLLLEQVDAVQQFL